MLCLNEVNISSVCLAVADVEYGFDFDVECRRLEVPWPLLPSFAFEMIEVSLCVGMLLDNCVSRMTWSDDGVPWI